MEDQQIIQLYLARSEQAIAETHSKYGPYCRRIAMNILADLLDTEECVNDTYLQTWNAIPPTIPERLQAFIGKITRNLSLNMYKAKNAQKRQAQQYALAYEELSAVLGTGKTEDAYIDELFLRELLEGFLEELSQESRWAFVGRYWYFDSVREISQKLQISESKTKMLLHRTRNALRELLRKEGVL